MSTDMNNPIKPRRIQPPPLRLPLTKQYLVCGKCPKRMGIVGETRETFNDMGAALTRAKEMRDREYREVHISAATQRPKWGSQP